MRDYIQGSTGRRSRKNGEMNKVKVIRDDGKRIVLENGTCETCERLIDFMKVAFEKAKNGMTWEEFKQSGLIQKIYS